MESAQNSSSPILTSTPPKSISMDSTMMPSSPAATPTTSTFIATQSTIPKSVEPAVPVFVQPDLASRPVSPFAQPTPTALPQVKKSPAPSSNVQPSVYTSITQNGAAIKSVAPHAASKQHISADATSLNSTSKLALGASSHSSHHDDSGETVLPQPVIYIIIAGIALAVILAGFAMWSCVQKRNRRRSRKASFSMSQASEKEWGTTREMAGGMESVYRHSVITYDAKAQPKLLYEDLDFGPMVTSQLPSHKELNQYKKDTIVCLTDVYGSTKGWDGSEFDYMLNSPNQFPPARSSPDLLSSLPKALLTGNHTGRQPAVPGFRPYRSPSGQLMVKPFSSTKMSPAEASNELQKIINAHANLENFDDLFDHGESFDSSNLANSFDGTPIHSNPEHFPILLGSFPAARKLSSSFLPGADKTSFTDDQAVLTGESHSVTKSTETVNLSGAVKQDMVNILCSGTTIVTGKAQAVVVFTCSRTAIGDIHESITSQISSEHSIQTKGR
ncbi:Sarcoplasmic/endoplasmic reticulum calcium ATPase 3 [Puccinia graminis f. sp. tritici]|uniref:Sarcoplasmic/endoplasmic reticulum calcium ATPase 3 n=1 Tax=Puccinia graminis f. sp. tritici TaxID=56615 RepID=A0A5B0M6C6_PUCGR|nr:Sarcoplasmic/endoplasmic reticulum calcium ATPase 3 [Puccinia graminis f. sp. tritici]